MNKKIYLIGEFSKLTGVSKSTLHHWSKIGFFDKRNQENEYRLFSAIDFITVQNILTLKIIGFQLRDINKIINNKMSSKNLSKNIINQIGYMNKQIRELTIIYKSLSDVLHIIENEPNEVILPLILKIIKDCNMYNNIKESWLKEVFTPETLDFLSKKKQLSISEEKSLIERWESIREAIEKAILDQINPKSIIGIEYARKWMDIVKSMGNSKEDEQFGMEVWAAYKSGEIEKYQRKFSDQKFFVDFPQAVISWIDIAITYMYVLEFKEK